MSCGVQCNRMMAAVLALMMGAATVGCGGGDARPVEEPDVSALPAEDQSAALAQRTCPVDGRLLGSQGTPSKVDARGNELFVCSAACAQRLKANPQQYLDALKAEETE